MPRVVSLEDAGLVYKEKLWRGMFRRAGGRQQSTAAMTGRIASARGADCHVTDVACRRGISISNASKLSGCSQNPPRRTETG